MAIQDIVDRERRRTQLIDQHHPAQVLRGEQPEAFGPRQLLPANLIHGPHLLGVYAHTAADSGRPSAGPGYALTAHLARRDHRVASRDLCRALTPASHP